MTDGRKYEIFLDNQQQNGMICTKIFINNNKIWGKHFACWICKATRAYAEGVCHAPGHTRKHTHARTHVHTHKEKYVTLTAFLLQQWLRERASVLRYTYIACLVSP